MDDENTVRIPGGPSVIGIYLTGLGRRLGELAGDVAEAARASSSVEGEALEALIAECGASARELGGYAHDMARDLEQIVRVLKSERSSG